MAGRPKANIDWDMVDKYLQSHCDGAGIAGLFGIHPNTLYEECKRLKKCNFSEYSAQKKSEGKELLRAKMFEQALGGDKSLQIFLSKQYLGMSDKQEIAVTKLPDIPNVTID